MSCTGYAEPHFDIRYFSIEFASRLFAIAKFTPRFYTVWAICRPPLSVSNTMQCRWPLEPVGLYDLQPTSMMSINELFASCQRKAIPCPNWLRSGYGELEKQITFWATCGRTHTAPLLDFDSAHRALAKAFQAGPPWLSKPMFALSSMVFSMMPARPKRSSLAMSL